MNSDLKNKVRDYWNNESCGEIYATGDTEKNIFESHSKKKYELEPYIAEFARFDEGHDKDVLEIGIGMGADHLEWAKSRPKSLTGVDLTQKAVEHTKRRLGTYNLESSIKVADA